MAKEHIKVYIQTPSWFIRPRNTDWRYTRFNIPRLSNFIPECEFHLSRSRAVALDANARYLKGILRHRLHIPFKPDAASHLDRQEFLCSGCDLVYCHDSFPGNADSIPIVWQNSILDPEMKRARGDSEEDIGRESATKKLCFAMAARVQVSTEAECVRLSRWFPELADKFVAVPFFLPDVRPIAEDDASKKFAPKDGLRCLFVGHEARRKGLARVYAAFSCLPPRIQRRLHLTVVSAQTDGKIEAPSLPNLRVCGALPSPRVQDLLRESDVLLMPSFFESYGIIFLEAMSQAAIPVVPDWEVQREIVDYGAAGIVTSGDPLEIARKLEELLDDGNLRIALATNARKRFETSYAPEVVAEKFRSLFHRAARPHQA
ncbi:MAG TPA: glycosyltransferase family 4 protein [Terracidiphilus sp.]|nr:glycosyltransferase family 4 protein [Terracidiphilus sp.]